MKIKVHVLGRPIMYTYEHPLPSPRHANKVLAVHTQANCKPVICLV